jgi:hypothetical protein
MIKMGKRNQIYHEAKIVEEIVKLFKKGLNIIFVPICSQIFGFSPCVFFYCKYIPECANLVAKCNNIIII